MTAESSLGTWVLAWASAAALIFFSRSQSNAVAAGLVPALLVGLAMRYLIPAALYLLPWSARSFDPDLVAIGFQISTFAVFAFGAGSLLFAPACLSMFNASRPLSAARQHPQLRLAKTYMAVGLMCFVFLLPVVGRVPTISALVIQGWGLMIVGLGLASWYTWHHQQSRSFLLWLCITLCLPLVTIVTQGFLGYGTAAATAVLALLASFYRPRWKAIIVGLALVYFGLSIYVTYMRDREIIRASDGVIARVQSVYTTVRRFEWFNLSNQQHLDRIDVRLNQNYLVGSAVQYLDSGLAHFAYGQTIVDGALSLVPRIIWPSKPQVAGSGTLVSQYTGLEFASGTAVGIGLVMESYVSFGTAGVCVAFALLGTGLTLIDRAAGLHLRRGDWPGFMRWFLPGLALLQTESSIVEVTSSVGAAIVVAWLVGHLCRYSFSRQTSSVHMVESHATAAWQSRP